MCMYLEISTSVLIIVVVYWYILSALTIYIDVTSPSFCGRSQLCNDPDTYQALGSVERRHRIY